MMLLDFVYGSNSTSAGLSRPVRGGSPSEVPDSQSCANRRHLSIEELVQQPGRRHCTPLDPFLLDHICQLDKVYEKPSDIHMSEIDIWFRTFAQHFTWEPELTGEFRKGFETQVRPSYKHHKSSWKKKWDTNQLKKSTNLSPDVWNGLGQFWSKSTTKVQSKKNSKNRLSQRSGKGYSTQNGGLKSIEESKLW
ncbi:unnamed protein product [Arabis nemorensis]|uniref:Uncharacterized protein n=1 Tax=Arabis nemorensis TaxID=586526 RepID=A0A565CN38_9BRAS|nr:unnamed protein product [Arabis nemorensis]